MMKALITVLMGFACSVLGAEQQAGRTIMAKGVVEAAAAQQVRSLQRRSPVFLVDNVSTGIDSATQLRMIDGGLLSMTSQTELAIRSYEFDQASAQGNISLSLLKGGLRTITGSLQQNGSNYELETPVATIGVRGTHYQARLEQGDLFLAAWQGVIDVRVTAAKAPRQFALGVNQPYRYAIVRADGAVEFLLASPAQFATGHSQDLSTGAELAQQSLTPAQQLTDFSEQATVDVTKSWLDTSPERYDSDNLIARFDGPLETGFGKTGEVVFDVLSEHNFVSTAGPLTDLSMSMQLNFDTASIPTGNLSFTDSGGEWFAVFNGLIGEQALELNINFASHGNNLADGTITGLLIDDSSAILGQISLFELENPDIAVQGSYILGKRP